MIRIIDDRCTGKTSRLMLIAKEKGATFVCGNPRAMREKAKAYGIEGITFMSYWDFINSNKHDGKADITPVVIDEMEIFVRTITDPHFELIGYTISEEDFKYE